MNRSINRNPSTARRTGLLAHLAVPRAIYWGIQSPGFVGFQCGRVEGAVQNFARSGCHGSWRGGAALSLFASQGKRLRALSVRQGCGDVVGRNTVLPGQVNVAVPARPEGQRARPGGARDGFGRRPWPGRAPSRLQNSDARLLAARSDGGCGSRSGPPRRNLPSCLQERVRVDCRAGIAGGAAAVFRDLPERTGRVAP